MKFRRKEVVFLLTLLLFLGGVGIVWAAPMGIAKSTPNISIGSNGVLYGYSTTTEQITSSSNVKKIYAEGTLYKAGTYHSFNSNSDQYTNWVRATTSNSNPGCYNMHYLYTNGYAEYTDGSKWFDLDQSTKAWKPCD